MKRIPKFPFEKAIIILTAVVVVYAAVISTLNFVTNPKIAYVNSAILLEKYPGAITARDSLNAQIERWSQNVKTLEKELEQLNSELITQAEKWDKKTLKKKQGVIKKKRQDYARYSRAVQEKAARLEQELFQPVYTEINAYMKDFGDKEGYEIIFGTLAGGNILYGRDAVNVTDEFLAYVRKRM
ncbi:MAG: OmpH family outer membrane protein [Calditrichaeota bacterium]|nr:MAG: OmpH family outer membrane protein [Calditrichota bacterium]